MKSITCDCRTSYEPRGRGFDSCQPRQFFLLNQRPRRASVWAAAVCCGTLAGSCGTPAGPAPRRLCCELQRRWALVPKAGVFPDPASACRRCAAGRGRVGHPGRLRPTIDEHELVVLAVHGVDDRLRHAAADQKPRPLAPCTAAAGTPNTLTPSSSTRIHQSRRNLRTTSPRVPVFRANPCGPDEEAASAGAFAARPG